MVIRIIVSLFVCILFVLALVWGLTGGPSRAISAASTISSPLDIFTGGSSGQQFTLPWQTEQTTGPDISSLIGGDYSGTPTSQSIQDQLNALEDQYALLRGQTQGQSQTFGAPSPYQGHVSLVHAESTGDPRTEYIALQADAANTAPLPLGSWSLQSAYSGTRITIPTAAEPFISGAVNSLRSAYLEPGGYAIIASGVSPVGVSFRENICSGYLAQFQTFTPALNASCPSPAGELPYTQANVSTYGESCFSYLQNVPACHFPYNEPVQGVSQACLNFAATALSYNGCMQAHRGDPGFGAGPWRIYLNSTRPLWREHDVVRLLDEEGRTVDVFTF